MSLKIAPHLTSDQINELLREQAMLSAKKAYSPYSKACVGSAVLTQSGQVFTGANIENASYGGTVCAERVAIFKAVFEGEKQLKKVYVYTEAGWPPCGFCRQVISEFAHPELKIVIGNKDQTIHEIAFKELMPLSFTPEHLTPA